jgi:hypothetical protein
LEGRSDDEMNRSAAEGHEHGHEAEHATNIGSASTKFVRYVAEVKAGEDEEGGGWCKHKCEPDEPTETTTPPERKDCSGYLRRDYGDEERIVGAVNSHNAV